MLKPTTDIFKLMLAMPVLTEAGEHPRLIEVVWVLNEAGDHAVQIYVDRVLRDTVLDPKQRTHLLSVDRRRPHVIEMLAVDPSHAFVAMPEHLNDVDPPFNTTWSLNRLRNESLPTDAVVHIQRDGQTAHRRPLWESHVHRGGFGALFGIGDFGADAATGPGLGRGDLGHGPLGSDSFAFRYRDAATSDHQTSWTFQLQTPAGEAVTPLQTQSITADLPDEPPTSLTVDATHWRW